MAAEPEPIARIPASASPIVNDRVASIRMTLSVALLTRPDAQGDLALEAPGKMVPPDACFSLRYFVHGRARRAVVQALRVSEASATRDVVTVRLISDTSVQERASSRQPTEIRAICRRRDGTEVPIDVADISRTGIGFECAIPLPTGEQVVLEFPNGTEPICAAAEVVRYEAGAAVQAGVRFGDTASGAAWFRAALTAIWTTSERPVDETADEDGGTPGVTKPRGMHGRRADR